MNKTCSWTLYLHSGGLIRQILNALQIKSLELKTITMTDKIEQFFKAYWTTGMKSVHTDSVPGEMMRSAIDQNGWYEWKLIPGTLTADDYKRVEVKFNVTFPD